MSVLKALMVAVSVAERKRDEARKVLQTHWLRVRPQDSCLSWKIMQKKYKSVGAPKGREPCRK